MGNEDDFKLITQSGDKSKSSLMEFKGVTDESLLSVVLNEEFRTRQTEQGVARCDRFGVEAREASAVDLLRCDSSQLRSPALNTVTKALNSVCRYDKTLCREQINHVLQ